MNTRREIQRIETRQVSEKYQLECCCICMHVEVCDILNVLLLLNYGVVRVRTSRSKQQQKAKQRAIATTASQLASHQTIHLYLIPWCSFLFKYNLRTILIQPSHFYYTHNTYARTNTHTLSKYPSNNNMYVEKEKH